MDAIVREFLSEGAENLDRLDRDLLALTRDPGSPHLLANLFRTLHTVKGTSGCLALHRLEELAHAGETLLVRLRDRELALTPAVARLLHELVAAIRLLLARIAATGDDAGPDVGRVLAAVRAAAAERVEAERVETERVETERVETGWVEAERSETERVETERSEAERLPSTPPAEAGEFVPADALDRVGEPSIRVAASELDTLLRLAGELAGAGDEFTAHAERLADAGLLASAGRLDRIAADLRAAVRRSRMQPVELVWSRFPRLVRVLGDQCGKQVRLQMAGSEIELDRGVLEAIRDPLTHLVRNAVDHGIEPAEQRLAAGKPAHGTLRLHARTTTAGQVVVEVADDGAGIDLRAVGSGALARGLVTSDQLAAMSVGELRQLVFRPGLSTAPAVTRVSGRGVGMDVVKTNVEGVGGSVEIDSEPGRGTTCRLRVPKALIGDERCAQSAVSA
ncbi:MAG TPA: ATP-binding protein [Jatrophihabitans sp.]|nr:ATP-binding protein [Jatrophihabitans sp.]